MLSNQRIFMIMGSVALVMLSAIVHEVAHGWVAYKLGDPTAKQAGRLTLNPLAHLDPVGSVLLPLLMDMAAMAYYRTTCAHAYNWLQSLDRARWEEAQSW